MNDRTVENETTVAQSETIELTATTIITTTTTPTQLYHNIIVIIIEQEKIARQEKISEKSKRGICMYVQTYIHVHAYI